MRLIEVKRGTNYRKMYQEGNNHSMLNKIIHIQKNDIPLDLFSMPVVLYGGGSTGRLILELMIQNDIQVAYIIDDSVNLQGTYIKQVKIISYKEFYEFSKRNRKIAVVVTTIYAKAIINVMSLLQGIQLYELYDWIFELSGDKQWLQKMVANTKSVQELKKQIDMLRGNWADKESEYVLDAIVDYINTEDLDEISKICSLEDHYLIPEVMKVMKSPIIIDAGACRGELLTTLQKKDVKFEKCYFFETNYDNFKYLESQIQKKGNTKHICINKGLWCETKKLYFFEGNDIAGGKIVQYETDQMIDVVSIDDFFSSKRCDYIKMDIEGAEYEALEGGINVIRRDRPVLAISIYHSLEDFWRIPQYLMSELNNYKYYVRQHSLIFGETVLYAIPY